MQTGFDGLGLEHFFPDHQFQKLTSGLRRRHILLIRRRRLLQSVSQIFQGDGFRADLRDDWPLGFLFARAEEEAASENKKTA